MKKNLIVTAAVGMTLVAVLAQENANNKAVPVNPEAAQKQRFIQQPQMTAAILAEHYTDFTGKRVIISNAAQAKVINLILPGEMTKAEAALVLEKACLLEGLVFVPSGPKEVKLVLSQNAKNQGLPFITEEILLPPGDAVVSYLMKFDNIAPEDALRAFQSIVGTVKSHGSVTALDNANALVITENASLIRNLIKVKAAIDIPQSSVSRKMIQLEHADAEALSEKLKLIITSQLEEKRQVSRNNGNNASRGNNNANRPRNNNTPQPTNPNSNSNTTGDAGQIQQIQVVADTRTNSVFVMGRPVDIIFVEGLVKDFDQPIKVRNFYTHRLKYLPVSEFLPVLESGIQQVSGDSLFGGNSASNVGNNNRNNNNNSAGGNRGTDLSAEERSEVPQAALVGKTLLVADSTNNTLIVQGPPQSIDVAKNLIKQMDVAGKQVQITAVFGRYSMNGDESFGVDFARTSAGGNGRRAFAGQTNTGFPILASPNTLITPELLPQAATGIAGLALYGQVSNNFFAYLRALESTGKFKLLARPSLFTTNNRRAMLSSGQRIAVPTSTLTQSNGNGNNGVASNTTIEFEDVLLRLDVVPLVNSDDEVTLKISFVNDNVVGSQNIGGNNIPTIGTEELLTTVKVPNNGTIVLGGLITERVRDSKNGIPILSSIPGIGKIFSSTQKETTKEELVILIQPRIVDGLKSLSRLQNTNASQSEILKYNNGALQMPELNKINNKKKASSRNVTRPTQQNPGSSRNPKPGQDPDSPRDRFRGSRR